MYAVLRMSPSTLSGIGECPFHTLHLFARSKTKEIPLVYTNRGNIEQAGSVHAAAEKLIKGEESPLRYPGLRLLGFEIPAIALLNEVLAELYLLFRKVNEPVLAENLKTLWQEAQSKAQEVGFKHFNIMFSSFIDGLAMYHVDEKNSYLDKSPSTDRLVILEAKSTDVGMTDPIQTFKTKRGYYTSQTIIYLAAAKNQRIPYVINPVDSNFVNVYGERNVSVDHLPHVIYGPNQEFPFKWDNYDVDVYYVFINANEKKRNTEIIEHHIVPLIDMFKESYGEVYNIFMRLIVRAKELIPSLKENLKQEKIDGYNIYIAPPATKKRGVQYKEAEHNPDVLTDFINPTTREFILRYYPYFHMYEETASKVLKKFYDSINEYKVIDISNYPCEHCNFAEVSCPLPTMFKSDYIKW